MGENNKNTWNRDNEFVSSTSTRFNLGPSRRLDPTRNKRGVFGCPRLGRSCPVRRSDTRTVQPGCNCPTKKSFRLLQSRMSYHSEAPRTGWHELHSISAGLCVIKWRANVFKTVILNLRWIQKYHIFVIFLTDSTPKYVFMYKLSRWLIVRRII